MKEYWRNVRSQRSKQETELIWSTAGGNAKKSTTYLLSSFMIFLCSSYFINCITVIFTVHCTARECLCALKGVQVSSVTLTYVAQPAAWCIDPRGVVPFHAAGNENYITICSLYCHPSLESRRQSSYCCLRLVTSQIIQVTNPSGSFP